MNHFIPRVSMVETKWRAIPVHEERHGDPVHGVGGAGPILAVVPLAPVK